MTQRTLYMRIGDQPEREIGTISADSGTDGLRQVARALGAVSALLLATAGCEAKACDGADPDSTHYTKVCAPDGTP